MSRLDAIDRLCLAATRAPWSSFAPTWKLDLRGDVSVVHLQQALDQVVQRYPWAASTIRGGRWVVPEHATLRIEPAESEQAVLDAFLDVSERVLEVKWLSSGTLLFHQHHALADGRAFLEFLGAFFQALDAAERSAPNPLPTGLALRRRQYETVTARGFARVSLFLQGVLISLGDLWRIKRSPLDPLPSNVGTDYSGRTCTVHQALPLARLEALKAARTRHGLSSNEVLAGALVTALSRWSNQPGIHTLLMPVDVRPPGFVSFSNHLSNLQVRFTAQPSISALEQTKTLARTLAPHRASKTAFVRVAFDDWVSRFVPLETMRKAVLDDRALLTCFSFSNLLPLGVPGGDETGTWRTSRCHVERLRITTPCVPPQAVNLTVARSGSDAMFNFNFKDSAVSEAQVLELREAFMGAFDELAASL